MFWTCFITNRSRILTCNKEKGWPGVPPMPKLDICVYCLAIRGLNILPYTASVDPLYMDGLLLIKIV